MPSQWIKFETKMPPPNKWLGNQVKQYAVEIEKYLKGPATRLILGDMRDTVENWEHAPRFVSDYSEPYGTRKQIHVHPTGTYTTQWMRVSGGVRGRTITRKRAKTLVFQRDYTPKTRPGGNWGGPGTRSGPYHRPLSVEWPGIEGREFSKVIKERRQDRINRELTAISGKVFK